MSLIEKNIQKSIEIAYSLFSPVKNQHNYHFTFVFERSKLIGIGQNYPDKPNAKAMKIAKLFSVNHFQEFPFLHSETDVIGKLWGKKHLDRKMVFINIRLNKSCKLMKSRPCKNCQSILDALNIEEIYWSNNNGFYQTINTLEKEIFHYENNFKF